MAAADVTDTLRDPLSYWAIWGEGTAQTETAIGHRTMLFQWSIEELARKSGYGTHSWCAISPPVQGKIERYHRSVKNVVKLEHYYFPWELEKAISKWNDHYDHERYQESLDNVTPADG